MSFKCRPLVAPALLHRHRVTAPTLARRGRVFRYLKTYNRSTCNVAMTGPASHYYDNMCTHKRRIDRKSESHPSASVRFLFLMSVYRNNYRIERP